MSGRELDKLRKAHPLDHNAEPMHPHPEIERVGYSPFARTLDQLRDRCGEHGDAAVADAKWGAVFSCLFSGEGFTPSNSVTYALEAVIACRSDDRVKLGYPPAIDGKPHVSVLDAHAPENRDRLRTIGDQTLDEWEKAWRPGLTDKHIIKTHQYILACQAHREKEQAA